MAKIAKIIARDIINFRGNPTVEVDVVLSDGTIGRATIPAYISRSLYETVAVRGGSKRGCFGQNTMKVLEIVNNIIVPKVVGMDALDQAGVDRIMLELDGMYNKEIVGANTSLGVSLAVAKAAAASLNMPLYRYLGGFNTKQMPVPMVNILSGGKHNSNNLDFREFMIVPVGAGSFAEAIRMCTEVYYTLKGILEDCGRSTYIGEAGGVVPNLASNEEGLAVLLGAINKAGYKPGKQIALALDVAATDFFEDEAYNLPGEGFIKTPVEMVEYYTRLVDEYPIISIENGMARDDRKGWELFYRRLSGKIQLVGDDLFATNIERLGQGSDNKIGDAILIKVNQSATLSEILDKIIIAKNAGYTCIISHSSSETEDTVIADIAVGVNAAQIKGGAPARTEQVAVYNQLLRIEEELGKVGSRMEKSLKYNLGIYK
ncbi:phosphopyruvate hydratase [Sporomusa sp.]|uniref:phosphopyruvate hydratase n=1 Tax=Sporomusa sp. TaxID=2078658 RepID=UPI002B83F81C|nr:phosphopyruvate hydratase [Sporomusa sp.]HWR42108.1 phosphopyruvate hydratase [Sporomusa sp.]